MPDNLYDSFSSAVTSTNAAYLEARDLMMEYSGFKENISIQRADIVSLNNSFIELKGATDRTNEYSTVLFSLSRIDELKLINNLINLKCKI